MSVLRTCALSILAASLTVAALSCSSGSTVDDSPPADESEPRKVHVDEGPVLQRTVGVREVENHRGVEFEATAYSVETDHFYLIAELPSELAEYCSPRWGWDWASLRGSRHGVVAIDCADTTSPMTRTLLSEHVERPDSPLVVVRLVGGHIPESDLEIDLFRTDHDSAIGSVVHAQHPITITGIDEASEQNDDSRISNQFLDSFQHWLYRIDVTRDLRPTPGFFAFAANRLRMSHPGLTESAREQFRDRQRRSNQTMAVYSGFRSVEEALQTDRGLVIGRHSDAERTISIDDVEAIPMEEHPWDEMIAELDAPTVIEPLAEKVPADMFYAHFHDLRSFVRLGDEFAETLAPMFQALNFTRGSGVLERYETSLAIQRSGLSRYLGHLAVNDLAITTSDPFLGAGTSVSILFDIRDRDVLNTALDRYEAATREKYPELQASQVEIAGHTVDLLSTPNKVVNQHRLTIDDTLILSNSARDIAAFLAVDAGEKKNLTESGDFRYMRTIYPFDREAEDGFLFISDDFVANVISPRTQILSARRSAARADLAATNNAAMLYGWLEGKPPANEEELIAHDLFASTDIHHHDGESIFYSPTRGATSDAWGNLAAMPPISELNIDLITAEEAEAFERFSMQYQQLWQTYIDPIAARILHDDDGSLHVDARILPLIDASEYHELAEQVGDQQIMAPSIEGTAQWTVGVGLDSSIRRDLNMMARSFTGRPDIGLDWVGSWAMLGTLDRSGLWDMALAVDAVASADDLESTFGISDNFFTLLSRLPVYLGVDVSNSASLAITLTGLRAFVDTAAPGLIQWQDHEPYRDVPITRLTADTPEMADLAVQYAIADGIFLFSFELTTLEILIDNVLDDNFSSAVDKSAVDKEDDRSPMQAMINISPKLDDSWIKLAILGFLENVATESYRRARPDWMTLTHGLGGLSDDKEARRQAALNHLGYVPQDLHGGTYSVDESGRILHSIEGFSHDTILPEIPVESSPLSAAILSLLELNLQLSFDGEGDHQGLHTIIDWRR